MKKFSEKTKEQLMDSIINTVRDIYIRDTQWSIERIDEKMNEQRHLMEVYSYEEVVAIRKSMDRRK